MKAKIAILFVATSLVTLLAFQVTASACDDDTCKPLLPPLPSGDTSDDANVIINNIINNNVTNNNVIDVDDDAVNRGGGKGGGAGGGDDGGGRNCSRLDKPAHVHRCHVRR